MSILIILVILALIVAGIWGIAGISASVAEAKEAQAMLETARTAEIAAAGNLLLTVMVMLLVLIILVIAGAAVYGLYHRRKQIARKHRAGRHLISRAQQSAFGSPLEALLQMEMLRALRDMRSERIPAGRQIEVQDEEDLVLF